MDGHGKGIDTGLKGPVSDSTPPSDCAGILSTAILDDFETLDEHAEAWNALWQQARRHLPTASYEWVRTYLEHRLEPQQSWFCVVAHDDRRLVGVLPLIVAEKTVAGLTMRILRTPLGKHTTAFCPPLSSVAESRVLKCLIEAAWSRDPKALWIEIADVPEDMSLADYAAGSLHITSYYRTGRYLRVDGDQEAYQASLSRNFRSNQKKAANKLRKLEGLETSFVTGKTASAAQLPEFMTVEDSGWKGRSGSAIVKSPDLVAFYTALTDRLGDAGWLEWHFLRVQGKPIAVNLAIRCNRSIIVDKLAYDEIYKRCSPGGFLFQAVVDRAFADPAIDEINLLTEASWYDNWKMAKRQYLLFRFYNKRSGFSVLLGFVPMWLTTRARQCSWLRSIVRTGRRWMHKIRGTTDDQ